jgi:hypothetical protein
MSEETEPKPHADNVYLQRIARDMSEIRKMLTDVVRYMRDAESEVPEKIRRFTMYFHDVRDFVDMHRSLGQEPPEHILREIERCSDRFKHLLKDMYTDGGTFEKVRRDMTERGDNRYDHTRLITGIHQEPQA